MRLSVLREATTASIGAMSLASSTLSIPSLLSSRGPEHPEGYPGPVGAAALYYSAFSVRETGIEVVWELGSLVICGSVLAHGLTDTPLTKLYGRFPRGE